MSLVFFLWALTSAQASFFPESGPQPLSFAKSLSSPARAAQTEQLLAHFYNKVSPLVSNQGAELVIIPQWNDQRVNALATRKQGVWEIQVYGGLLTHPDIDDDELQLVLCHELGHHLGGAPTASRNGWAACEGQADYWSASACAHLFKDPEETALKLTRLYATQGAGGYPNLDRADEVKVPRTFFGYPSPQCRLDTLLAGFKGLDRPFCWYAPEK
ncbi:MAG: hypothetical protein K2P81_10240 [Bacteriovoracaceae bacterium]|nr:hypothetical protein [Bacteriovoracaceae bacterium]